MLHGQNDTICALATAAGNAGLAVIRVSGPSAFTISDAITRRAKNTLCSAFTGHTLHRASVIEVNGAEIDDVLLGIFHGPRSYTGEDVVEISGHGGTVSTARIIERLLAAGARMARPGEFTQRAFMNGKMDLAQAEAVCDVIAARTEEAHRLAKSQQAGKLSTEVTGIRDVMLGALARIEASIDFPEDVGELDAPACRAELTAAEDLLNKLLATADRGILFRDGAQVVLTGRPNVGKSSLLNALLRTSRAIVTPIPGTTRDTIEETLNLRGIPVTLVDTAGLRETDDLVESIGVDKTRERIAAADFVLLILDSVEGEHPEDAVLRAGLPPDRHLVVWNKWDLCDTHDLPSNGVAVSAATGWNIEHLEDILADALIGENGALATSEGAAVTHARHRHALVAANARIRDAIQTLDAELPADFVSIDVRGALQSLGEITGETANEDIINEIFARFCIGK